MASPSVDKSIAVSSFLIPLVVLVRFGLSALGAGIAEAPTLVYGFDDMG